MTKRPTPQRFRNQPATDQDRVIATVRRAWGLAEPKGDRIPKWFTRAVSEAIRAGELSTDFDHGDAISRLVNGPYREIFDHPGCVTINGERCVAGEPYETTLSTDRARAMAGELAGILRCRWRVSLRSWHYPGYTIRVVFMPAAEATK